MRSIVVALVLAVAVGCSSSSSSAGTEPDAGRSGDFCRRPSQDGDCSPDHPLAWQLCEGADSASPDGGTLSGHCNIDSKADPSIVALCCEQF